MNYLFFILKSALDDFRRNKVRTILTSLGILIGVSSVVLLLAFGLGLKKYIENQFESLGANLIMVVPGGKNTFLQGGFVGGIKFDDRDVNKLKRIKTIKYMSGAYAKPGSKIQANGKTEITEVIAANEEIASVMNLVAEDGKLFGKSDIQKGSKTVMIYTPLAEKLFGTAKGVVGQNVSIDSQKYKVLAVLKAKGGGGIGGVSIDHQTFIPFKASFSFNAEKKYFGIYLKTVDKESVAETKTEIENVLVKRYNKDDFSVLEEKEIMDTISSIFNIINTVLVAIAAISLIVGGIGIMNIMYVSVVERIREIGIRRAIGATSRDILMQFLSEAVILSLLGGIIGLLFSFLIVFVIQKFFPAYINLLSIMIALGVSSLIGIVFGVFPAKRAADLSPIEAIRYE